MINIKLKTNKFIQKIFLYLTIAIFIFISNIKIIFSKELNKNIKNPISPEEELAIKYCDSLNKNIFNGLNKELLLKYEYYFSNLEIPKSKDAKEFYTDFKLNVWNICSYELTEMDKEEFLLYVKRYLKLKH